MEKAVVVGPEQGTAVSKLHPTGQLGTCFTIHCQARIAITAIRKRHDDGAAGLELMRTTIWVLGCPWMIGSMDDHTIGSAR
ncbi:hypothetical protein K503DRAFT_156022 [Rhizopogon vinicolor AM-OR11-026]|uniref:Uncharacterized protein n=1 Tax=Rhizopogon vinicolor AM-OR11-026 TaxID=1314800 RepID=A0A1B7NFA7_9AGAM|nr:hypothetical protein K503DRAFT_156022 [Rhizopogon vinicolor AM-OR11-026]